jgi:hypothetical protein
MHVTGCLAKSWCTIGHLSRGAVYTGSIAMYVAQPPHWVFVFVSVALLVSLLESASELQQPPFTSMLDPAIHTSLGLLAIGLHVMVAMGAWVCSTATTTSFVRTQTVSRVFTSFNRTLFVSQNSTIVSWSVTGGLFSVWVGLLGVSVTQSLTHLSLLLRIQRRYGRAHENRVSLMVEIRLTVALLSVFAVSYVLPVFTTSACVAVVAASMLTSLVCEALSTVVYGLGVHIEVLVVRVVALCLVVVVEQNVTLQTQRRQTKGYTHRVFIAYALVYAVRVARAAHTQRRDLHLPVTEGRDGDRVLGSGAGFEFEFKSDSDSDSEAEVKSKPNLKLELKLNFTPKPTPKVQV